MDDALEQPSALSERAPLGDSVAEEDDHSSDEGLDWTKLMYIYQFLCFIFGLLALHAGQQRNVQSSQNVVKRSLNHEQVVVPICSCMFWIVHGLRCLKL